MKRLYSTGLLMFVLLLQPDLFAQTKKIRIACIGASITAGARLKDPARESYPAQLGTLLGDRYEVRNFGVSGCTMLSSGDKPYMKMPEYQQALAFMPDIVTIDLGGNDSKLINRGHLNEYINDCRELVRSFTDLSSHPRVILLQPVVSFVTDTTGIWDPVIVNRIMPLLRDVAYEDDLELFNPHPLLADKPALMPDQIHPELEGTTIMAKALFQVLSADRDIKFDVFAKLPADHKISSFHGYRCADFIFNGRSCKVVAPKKAAKDHPWIWRARFWGHEPQTDIGLLERGYHVVYSDVAELLGNKEAISLWDKFYNLMQRSGLAKKAALEGMSRGAVYAFNWAAVNADKVTAVYVDNPLLNIPDWALKIPAGKKDDMLDAFKKDYALQSEEDIRRFRGSPVDHTAAIVKGHYPVLIICADADEAVDPKQNTLLFEKKIKALKGDITVIHKPGFKHHPHSLVDPTPIIDFIISAREKK
jgi:lysophospholipase L1-like esterase/pimeloyl-ACP methyl ester carboxylesterase